MWDFERPISSLNCIENSLHVRPLSPPNLFERPSLDLEAEAKSLVEVLVGLEIETT
jgi:hypothetical protein